MSKYYEVTDGDIHVGYVSEEYCLKKFDERVLTGKTEYNFLIGEDEAIDVEPVKHGHWISDGHHIRCDQCGMYMCDTDREGDRIPTEFCPNCGSKMGDEDEK